MKSKSRMRHQIHHTASFLNWVQVMQIYILRLYSYFRFVSAFRWRFVGHPSCAQCLQGPVFPGKETSALRFTPALPQRQNVNERRDISCMVFTDCLYWLCVVCTHTHSRNKKVKIDIISFNFNVYHIFPLNNMLKMTSIMEALTAQDKDAFLCWFC